jgi:hypothetical protein
MGLIGTNKYHHEDEKDDEADDGAMGMMVNSFGSTHMCALHFA